MMGFTDDVVIQVKGDDAHAIIDVRSVSRYGMHDLGANAARIRKLFEEVTARWRRARRRCSNRRRPRRTRPPTRGRRQEGVKKAR